MNKHEATEQIGPSAAALDRSVLEGLREALDDVSGAFITNVAGVFETQAIDLMADLIDAAQKSDVPRLGFAAHSLKGSSANVGGNRLAGLCAELEHWDGPLAELNPKVASIEQELAALLAELREFLPT